MFPQNFLPGKRSMRSFLFLTFISLSLTGCGNLFYLSKLGWHQSFITFHSVPVQEVLEQEGVEDEAKEKIRFVQEVKRYGEEKLGPRGTTRLSRKPGPIARSDG